MVYQCTLNFRVSRKMDSSALHTINIGLQWNLSNPDTLGTEESVLISEVS